MHTGLILAGVAAAFIAAIAVGGALGGVQYNERYIAHQETVRAVCTGDLANDGARAITCAKLTGAYVR